MEKSSYAFCGQSYYPALKAICNWEGNIFTRIISLFYYSGGNRYPCFHGFQGGKGVANYLGFTLYTAPYAVLLSAMAWLICFACFRIPFIGSFVMVVILAGATMARCEYGLWCSTGVVFTVLFIILAHRQNMSEFIQSRRA